MKNLRNVEHKKINIQGISLNEWKLYFSKLLKEDRREFLNGVTEKEDDKNTENIHLGIERVEIAIASLKNGTVHFTFVDMEKAYDTEFLQKLWQALEDMETAIKAIKNARSVIKIENFLSEEIKLEKGSGL